MATYDISTRVCVLSVAYGLRNMGAISRGEQGVTRLLDDFKLSYRSDRRYMTETYFARTEDELDDFETAVAKLHSADFKVDRNVDAFVDNRAARRIIKAGMKPRPHGWSRIRLVEDYVQGKALGYPKCCVNAYLDWNYKMPDEDNEYVPWHSCNDDCKASARFAKRMEKVLGAVGVIKSRPINSVNELMKSSAKLS